jgi:hypothetical protein
VAYFERWPVYESEVGRSVRLYDVLPEKVTVRERPRFYWHVIPAWANDLPENWTVFEEVSIVEQEETWSEEVRAFLAMLRGVPRETLGLEQFAGVYLEAMCEAISRAWAAGRCHFVLHSAGHDSRMMSLALKELGDLGDTLFLECDNEADEFKRLMEMLGWENYVVFNEGAEAGEYHANSFDFRTAWQRMEGGMRPYPFNLWWDTVEWAQGEGLLPGDYQGWSGFTANWVMRITTQDEEPLEELLPAIPRNALSAVPLKGDWVFPYVDLEFMETMWRYGKGQSQHVTSQVVEYLWPESKAVRNPVDVRYKAVSDRLYRQALADYQGSWYGQQRYHPAVQEIEFDKWWGHWGLASLCEQLKEEGRDVELRNLL